MCGEWIICFVVGRNAELLSGVKKVEIARVNHVESRLRIFVENRSRIMKVTSNFTKANVKLSKKNYVTESGIRGNVCSKGFKKGGVRFGVSRRISL